MSERGCPAVIGQRGIRISRHAAPEPSGLSKIVERIGVAGLGEAQPHGDGSGVVAPGPRHRCRG